MKLEIYFYLSVSKQKDIECFIPTILTSPISTNPFVSAQGGDFLERKSATVAHEAWDVVNTDDGSGNILSSLITWRRNSGCVQVARHIARGNGLYALSES